MVVCVVVGVGERAGDCWDDVSPHPGQGGSATYPGNSKSFALINAKVDQ
jgi:hypothetical protein